MSKDPTTQFNLYPFEPDLSTLSDASLEEVIQTVLALYQDGPDGVPVLEGDNVLFKWWTLVAVFLVDLPRPTGVKVIRFS
jgi:hypothetical protein